MTIRKKKTATASQLFAWALYDWANSAFFVVIQTFVFAAYFVEAVAENSVDGSAIWGYTIGTAGLVVAITGPFLGAIADQYGRRKPWLFSFALLSIVATGCLWFVKPDVSSVTLALILVFLATIGSECSIIFYNSLLPDLAPKGKTGRWSGWAAGLGYAGGLVCLLLLFFMLITNSNPPFGLKEAFSEPVRATFIVTALWYLLFSLPLLFFTPDVKQTGSALAVSVRKGWRQLKSSLKEVKKYKNVAIFLLARLLFIDGLATLFAFGGIYAASVFNLSTSEVLWFGIGLNLTAGIGAAIFAWVDDYWGSRIAMLIALGGLIITTLSLLLITSVFWFWIFGLILGLFVGPLYAASRSYMSYAAPERLQTQMFGLMALSGKVTAFIGPFLVGWLTYLSGSQRVGMSVILVLFAAGFIVLLQVPKAFENRA